MSGKRTRDYDPPHTETSRRSGARPRSGVERSSPDPSGGHRRDADDSRRGDRHHKRHDPAAGLSHGVLAATNGGGVLPIDPGFAEAHPPFYQPCPRRSHEQTILNARPYSDAIPAAPPRPERTRVPLDGLDPRSDEIFNPNAGVELRDQNIYPPIVTIDGRVDTDLDHLIDDDEDDDNNYTGPVEEPPSRFPRPHVFSVIHGSLDDDVDSYANDDGTMEHTLVDAPKNFHPRDLQDVASNDGGAPRSRSGQAKGGNKPHRSTTGPAMGPGGGPGSQLLSYSDRSHNKMHPDSCDGERLDTYAEPKKQQHWQPKRQSGNGGSNHVFRRQVLSEEVIPTESSQFPPKGASSDHIRPGGNSPKLTKGRVWRPSGAEYRVKEDSRLAGGWGVKERSVPLDHVRGLPGRLNGQPSPGRSMSEQTQKSRESRDDSPGTRPASCTPTRGRERPTRSGGCSPLKKSFTNFSGGTDKSDEENTFITCKETLTIKSPDGTGKPKEASNGQDMQPCKRTHSDSPSPWQRERGEEGERSCHSSVSGMDSLTSDHSHGEWKRSPTGWKRRDNRSSDPPMIWDRTQACNADACWIQNPWRESEQSSRRNVSGKHSRRGELERDLSSDHRDPAEDRTRTRDDEQRTKIKRKTKRRSGRQFKEDGANIEFYDAKENKDDIIQRPHEGQGSFPFSRVSELYYTSRAGREMDGSRSPDRYYHLNGRSGNHKQLENPHEHNTIWHGTRGFEPIEKTDGHYRYSPSQKRHDKKKRDYKNLQRGSNSPLRIPKEFDMYMLGEKSKHREERKRSKHLRRSSRDEQNWLTDCVLPRKYSDPQDTGKSRGFPFDLEYERSPDTWTGVDSHWRRDPERRRKHSHHRRLSGHTFRMPHRQRMARASWSFESDRTPRSHRMLRYQSRKLSLKEREEISRTMGTPVDDMKKAKYLVRKGIGCTKMVQVGAEHHLDEDLKESLKEAMDIARKSLAAAAQVSKALNLVMSNSAMSIDSCSLIGSPVDSRSIRRALEAATGRATSTPIGFTSSVCSRYTDGNGMTPSQTPLVVNGDKDIVIRTGDPNGHGQSNVTDSKAYLGDSQTPIVSIFIGEPGGQQRQVARIFPTGGGGGHHESSATWSVSQRQHESSSHCEKDNNKLPGGRQQPTSGKVPGKPGENCDAKWIIDPNKLQQQCPEVTQTTTINYASLEVLKVDLYPEHTDTSSQSQVFESTCDVFKEESATIKVSDEDEVPTHEDGTKSRETSEWQTTTTSFRPYMPSAVKEQYFMLGEPVYPRESRPTVVAAALDYLSRHPDTFSPRTEMPPYPDLDVEDLPSLNDGDMSGYCSSYDTPDDGLAHECHVSPSSCVDPESFRTSGSAVDPPHLFACVRVNANANWAEEKVSAMPNKVNENEKNFRLNCQSSNCTIVSFFAHETSPPKQAMTNETKATAVGIGDSISYAQRCGKNIVNDGAPYSTIENTETDKIRRRRLPSRKRMRGAKHTKEEAWHKDQARLVKDERKACSPQDNANNNSSPGGGAWAGPVSPRRQAHAQSLSDGEEEVPGTGSNRNQNKLGMHRHRSPPSQASLTQALRILSAVRDTEKRPVGTRSKREVKKSLCIAMKLAQESLSAAAKVTELLNQVVDVYHTRHSGDDAAIFTKLKTPNRQHRLDGVKYMLVDDTRAKSIDDTRLFHTPRGQRLSKEYPSYHSLVCKPPRFRRSLSEPYRELRENSEDNWSPERSKQVMMSQYEDREPTIYRDGRVSPVSFRSGRRNKLRTGERHYIDSDASPENEQIEEEFGRIISKKRVRCKDSSYDSYVDEENEVKQGIHCRRQKQTRGHKGNVQMISGASEESVITQYVYKRSNSIERNAKNRRRSKENRHDRKYETRKTKDREVNTRLDDKRHNSKHDRSNSRETHAENNEKKGKESINEREDDCREGTKKSHAHKEKGVQPNPHRKSHPGKGKESSNEASRVREKDGAFESYENMDDPVNRDKQRTISKTSDQSHVIAEEADRKSRVKSRSRKPSPVSCKEKAMSDDLASASVDQSTQREKQKNGEKTSELKRKTSKTGDRSEQADNHTSVSSKCVSEGRRPRSPHKTRLSEKPTGNKGDDQVSESKDKLGAGNGDTAAKSEKLCEKKTKDRCHTSQDAIPQEEHAHPRKKRLKRSKAAEIKELQPCGTPVDDPAIYKIATPVPSLCPEEGENYSFNRSLENNFSQIKHKPFKHKYPTSSDMVKQLLATHTDFSAERPHRFEKRDWFSLEQDFTCPPDRLCAPAEICRHSSSSTLTKENASPVGRFAKETPRSQNNTTVKQDTLNQETSSADNRQLGLLNTQPELSTTAGQNTQATYLGGTASIRLQKHKEYPPRHQQDSSSSSTLTACPDSGGKEDQPQACAEALADSVNPFMNTRDVSKTNFAPRGYSYGQWRRDWPRRMNKSSSPSLSPSASSSSESEESDNDSSSDSPSEHSYNGAEIDKQKLGVGKAARRYQIHSSITSAPPQISPLTGGAYAGLRRENSFHLSEFVRGRRASSGPAAMKGVASPGCGGDTSAAPSSVSSAQNERPLRWLSAHSESSPSPARNQRQAVSRFWEAPAMNRPLCDERSEHPSRGHIRNSVRSHTGLTSSGGTSDSDGRTSSSSEDASHSPATEQRAKNSSFNMSVSSSYPSQDVRRNTTDGLVDGQRLTSPAGYATSGAPATFGVANQQVNLCQSRSDGLSAVELANAVVVENQMQAGTTCTTWGNYPLYRPLDNIRRGSFSPILEESENIGQCLKDRVSPSPAYLVSCVGERQNGTKHNSNVDSTTIHSHVNYKNSNKSINNSSNNNNKNNNNINNNNSNNNNNNSNNNKRTSSNNAINNNDYDIGFIISTSNINTNSSISGKNNNNAIQVHNIINDSGSSGYYLQPDNSSCFHNQKHQDFNQHRVNRNCTTRSQPDLAESYHLWRSSNNVSGYACSTDIITFTPDGKDGVWANVNNNSFSRANVSDHDMSASERELTSPASDFLLMDNLSRMRRCRSMSVEPVPFGKVNRLPLPPIKPSIKLKVAGQWSHMPEAERWRLHFDNKQLCKTIVERGKMGCSFDIGLKNQQPPKRSSRSDTTRSFELERIAQENEVLFKRIVNRKPNYSREEQLRHYDKLLPKLIAAAKYPDDFIERHKLK